MTYALPSSLTAKPMSYALPKCLEEDSTQFTESDSMCWDSDISDDFSLDSSSISIKAPLPPFYHHSSTAEEHVRCKAKESPAFRRLRTTSESLPKKSCLKKNSSQSQRSKTVSFDKVQIREYQIVLGEHPARDNGPSLGLGWQFHEKKITTLDKYEAKKSSLLKTMFRTHMKKNNKPLPPSVREDKALKWGFTQDQIEKNCRRNIRVHQQRETSFITYDADMRENFECIDPVAFLLAAREAHGYIRFG